MLVSYTLSFALMLSLYCQYRLSAYYYWVYVNLVYLFSAAIWYNFSCWSLVLQVGLATGQAKLKLFDARIISYSFIEELRTMNKIPFFHLQSRASLHWYRARVEGWLGFLECRDERNLVAIFYYLFWCCQDY